MTVGSLFAGIGGWNVGSKGNGNLTMSFSGLQEAWRLVQRF